MSKYINDVPKSLYSNIHRILPMVVNKELPLEGVKNSLESSGLFYSTKTLLKFLTSYFFKKRLVQYLDALELNVNPEYYIELYLFP